MKEVSKQLANQYRLMGILDKWHPKTWDDFDNDPRALKLMKKYVINSEDALKDGVAPYLFGANGVGKSHLMNVALKELFHKGYSVQIMSVSSLITKFTQGWYDASERKALMLMLQKVQFLGLEEFGKMLEKGTDLHVTTIENILRFRVQMSKPTLITSNVPSSDIAKVYNDDVASMLKECSFDLMVSGSDKRDDIYNKNIEKYRN